MKKRMLSLLTCLALCLVLLPATASAEEPQNHTSHTGWTALTQDYIDKNGSTLASGSYYLSEDLTVRTNIQFTKDANVNLCLNGHILTLQDGSQFFFGGTVPRTLCLCDCQSSKDTYGNIDEETGLWKKSDSSGNCDLKGGVITGSTASAFWFQYFTLNMYGGNIAGNALGVSINYNSTFRLYGGSIVGNANSDVGGGVCINNWNGNFHMQGGSISHNSSSRGGGVYVNRGTCTIQDGSITGNTATYGGGVSVTGGTCNISSYNSYISNNTATGSGGGVYANGGGTCNITGGSSITDNSANNGGGVYITVGGICNLDGGTVSQNKSKFSGGGVFIYSGSFSMTAGDVSGNECGWHGGGICADNDAKLTLSDSVKISGNAAVRGGGVYINQETLELSGDVDLSGNTAGGDLYLRNLNADSKTAIQLTSPLISNQKISVTMYIPGVLVTNWKRHMGNEDPADYLDISANPGYHTGINGDGAVTLLANTYTVNFAPGEGGSGSMAPQAFTYDTEQALTPNAFTRTGYTFAGWSDGSGKTYTDGQAVKNLTAEHNGTVTLYAQWKINVNTYTVTLHPNEGKIDGSTPDSDGNYVIYYTYGIGAALPTEKEIARSGYRFDGWYDNEKLDGKPVTEITATDIGNKTYWAKWDDSSDTPTYSITLPNNVAGGKVSANKRYAEKGETFRFTVTSDDGWELDRLTVTDRNGKELDVTHKGDGVYTFKMPAGRAEIQVSFREIAPEPLPFTDVPANAWYAEAVRYVYEHGLMAGTSATTFAPDATTSRAMIATILWRMAGSPVVNYAMDFADVPEGQWYSEAIRWAASEGVVTGYGNGLFGTNDPITREQLATMLWRCAQEQGYDVSVGENTNILSYTDAFDVAEYAIPAMQWAVGAGIINGTGDGSTLTPQGQATRAQAAVMLMRFCE